jgi:hypothetical protein
MVQQVQEQTALHATLGSDQQRQLALLQQWTQVRGWGRLLVPLTSASCPCPCHLSPSSKLLCDIALTVPLCSLPGTLTVCVQKVLGCIKGMQQQWRQLVKVMQAAVAETAGQLQQQGGVLKQLQQQQEEQQAEAQQELELAQQQPSPTPQQEQQDLQESPSQAVAEPGEPVKEEKAAGASAAAAPPQSEERPAAVPPADGGPADGRSGLLPPQLQKPQQQAQLSRLVLMGVLQQQMLAVQAVEKSQGEQLTQLSQVRS